MNFRQARKKFKQLKLAWVNGAISREELQNQVDCELEVSDEAGNSWKIDEDSGLWLRFDEEQLAWIEDEPPVIETESELFKESEEVKVPIEPPPAPQVPEKTFNQWRKFMQDPDSFSQSKEPQEQPAPQGNDALKCNSCGRVNARKVKFCTECGATMSQKPKCRACGKELKPGNKFCTGCGQAVA